MAQGGHFIQGGAELQQALDKAAKDLCLVVVDWFAPWVSMYIWIVMNKCRLYIIYEC